MLRDTNGRTATHPQPQDEPQIDSQPERTETLPSVRVPEPLSSEPAFAPELNRSERQEVEHRAAVRPHVLHEAIRRAGEEELKRPARALAYSGLAAGLSMGFSLVTQGLIRAALPDQPWRPLIATFGYCIGFLIVILGRQQLFTENTVTAIIPLLARRDAETLGRVLRLWAIVLLANLAGALIFAGVVGNLDVFQPQVRAAFADIGREALRNDFGGVFVRGIFAGWLIALMVWLLPGADVSRLHVIVIITYVVGLGSLSHVVAGSVETLYLVVTGAASWLDFLGHFLVPTLLGNIVGGSALVAALNHAQVIAGRGEEA